MHCFMLRPTFSRRHRYRIFLLLICVFVTFMVIVAGESDSYFGSAVDSGDICVDKNTCDQLQAAGEERQADDGDADSRQRPETRETPEVINVLITFTNAARNKQLQEQFELTISSMLAHATVPLALHIIGDNASEALAARIIEQQTARVPVTVVHLDVEQLVGQVEDVVRVMQERFSPRSPGAYYGQALFFLSTALHRVLPLSRIIMLDADLKFLADIRLLYEEFHKFSEENVLGIAPEMQPVYRHLFWKVRGENKGTRIGEPRGSGGLPGFNSGVLLLDLDRMRKSSVYNSYLEQSAVEALADELHFKGHLGDQDFYTLLGMRHEELFHVLPCTFNRQLCTWWRDHGYKDVFPLYHDCPGPILIYHGNCKTPIP